MQHVVWNGYWSLAWVLLGSGICESSVGVASFGVLSENGAMVGVWRMPESWLFGL